MKRFLLPVWAVAALCASVPAGAQQKGSDTEDSVRVYDLEKIEVTATRATRQTPVAYTDISKREIDRRNFGADIPSLLQMTPSLVATSEAGNGIGGTAFRIRGTDPSRINVTANGVPMNDAESHSVYWYDTPDFASAVGTMQVQRGAGTSTNGTGAFGGSVNMTTAPLATEAGGEASLSYGSYNTNKQALTLSSGLVGGHWAFDGRLSHIYSDGYVDRASTDLKSYIVQGAWYGERTMIKLISFGGKARVYLAYDGVDKLTLESDRRYNSQGKIKHADGSVSFFDDQTDNYLQINNQLLVNYRAADRWTLNLTLHYTYGYGYYNQYKNGQTLAEYGLPPVADGQGGTVAESNLIRRKKMDNAFSGAIASANYASPRVQLSLGASWNLYDGTHWGDVTQVVAAPSFEPQEYYHNTTAKHDGNLFAKVNWQPARGLNLYGDVQYRLINHRIEGINDVWDGTNMSLQPLDIDRTYHFFNPKAGLSYDFGRVHNLYASFAVAQKEPTRSNFTDLLGGVYPTSERLYDWEAGYQLRGGRVQANVNFYYMKYRDQLVPTGQLSDTGEALSVNVPDSYRRGVELSASIVLARWLTLGANATLSQNRVERYTEYVDGKPIYLGTTDLAYSPSVIAGGLLDLHAGRFEAVLHTRYVGKQFFTNGSNDNLSLESYCVTDLNLGYTLRSRTLRSVRLGLAINNLFDAAYCNNGYGYSYYWEGERVDEAYYFPQAGINVLANVSVRF